MFPLQTRTRNIWGVSCVCCMCRTVVVEPCLLLGQSPAMTIFAHYGQILAPVLLRTSLGLSWVCSFVRPDACPQPIYWGWVWTKLQGDIPELSPENLLLVGGSYRKTRCLPLVYLLGWQWPLNYRAFYFCWLQNEMHWAPIWSDSCWEEQVGWGGSVEHSTGHTVSVSYEENVLFPTGVWVSRLEGWENGACQLLCSWRSLLKTCALLAHILKWEN